MSYVTNAAESSLDGCWAAASAAADMDRGLLYHTVCCLLSVLFCGLLREPRGDKEMRGWEENKGGEKGLRSEESSRRLVDIV